MFSKVGSANLTLGYQTYGQNVQGNAKPSNGRVSTDQSSAHASSKTLDNQPSNTSLLHSGQRSSFQPVARLSAASELQPQASSLSDRSSSSSSSSESPPTLGDDSQTDKLERGSQAQDQALISQLAARDREVRAHEQAHMAVGGAYAGAAKYQFQRGPDGVNYAVGGEVPIDVSKAANPEQTIRKAQIVRRAALAPAEPSPQDRLVAAEASRMEMQARQELALELRQEPSRQRGGSEASNANPYEMSDAISAQDRQGMSKSAALSQDQAPQSAGLTANQGAGHGGMTDNGLINSHDVGGRPAAIASRLLAGIAASSGFAGPSPGDLLNEFA